MIEIRKLLDKGVSYPMIANQYKVTVRSIFAIKHRITLEKHFIGGMYMEAINDSSMLVAKRSLDLLKDLQTYDGTDEWIRNKVIALLQISPREEGAVRNVTFYVEHKR